MCQLGGKRSILILDTNIILAVGCHQAHAHAIDTAATGIAGLAFFSKNKQEHGKRNDASCHDLLI
jgi:hypothetical protein